MLWIYPIFITPLFNKFTPLPEGELKDRILKLAADTKFKITGIYVMDASKRTNRSNAYFTGIGNNKRIVFFDTLTKQLSTDELIAVLAHELGHFRLKHIVKKIILSFALSLLAFLVLYGLYQSTWFFSGHNTQSSPYMTLILFSMVLPVYTWMFSPIFTRGSRKHEFQADNFAAQYVDRQHLISALVKLYQENLSELAPHPLYGWFHYSHPTPYERIQSLQKTKD